MKLFFTDRDKYIKVFEDNGNFKKLKDSDAETHGTPYDFLSIMHYPFIADKELMPATFLPQIISAFEYLTEIL